MSQNSAYEIDLRDIRTGENILAAAKGKFSLVINIATKAGYTPSCSRLWSYARTARQLWEMETLQLRYASRGFTVIGVPCNQFGRQEPAENQEIAEFLSATFPFVTFPISVKVDVNGKNEHPLYSFLKGPMVRAYDDNRADGSAAAAEGQNLAGQAMARVPHNYEKFLVSPEGKMVGRFNWMDLPLSEQSVAAGGSWTVLEALEEMLP